MEFHIGTGHGISELSYKANEDPEQPGQGSGQGMGSSLMLHVTSSDVTLSVYRMTATGATFQHPSHNEPAPGQIT